MRRSTITNIVAGGPTSAFTASWQNGDSAAPTKRGIEEVRLRLEPDEDLRARGLLGIEVGCAIVHGMGTAALVPELLVRVDRSGCAARVFESRLSRARISATFLFTHGRSASEQVIAIRPAFTSPSNLRRWVRWVLVTARAEPVALVEHARAIPSVGVQRGARPPMTPGAVPLAPA